MIVPDDSGLGDVSIDAGEEGAGDDRSAEVGAEVAETASCGGPTCCGSIPCFGNCTDQCDACANKCGGGQLECCVKQSLTCHALGSTCP
jgi:hypothetical protein